MTDLYALNTYQMKGCQPSTATIARRLCWMTRPKSAVARARSRQEKHQCLSLGLADSRNLLDRLCCQDQRVEPAENSQWGVELSTCVL